jgi:hypothetical protein
MIAHNKPPKITTFLSHAYIPFFLRSALFDEVMTSLKVMQQRNSVPVSDFLKLANVPWIKSLDKQMMFSYSLAWRLTYMQVFL